LLLFNKQYIRAIRIALKRYIILKTKEIFMILKITDQTGHSVADTDTDYDLAVDLFKKAVDRGMWGKGIKDGRSEFVSVTTLDEILDYDEVIMLPRQVGG
jgi:hypothetical protein